jgi:hypothetical protein
MIVSSAELAPVLAVLRGAEREHEELCAWIDGRFGVDVVAMVFDRARTDRERILVWVRTRAQRDRLLERGGGFHPAAQAAVAEHAGYPGRFVAFADAESPLRDRAVRAVGTETFTAAARLLPDPSIVWRIEGFFSRVTVFLHTDAQVETFRGTPQHAALADELWRLVHERDEFGDYPRAAFHPVLDSRQNYDDNFRGNGYYYYR